MEDDIVPLDKLVKIYRKLRTKMTELTQEYDTQAEVLKAQQDEIKNLEKIVEKWITIVDRRQQEIVRLEAEIVRLEAEVALCRDTGYPY